LYHSVFGTFDGMIQDVSHGGMLVLLDEIPPAPIGAGDGRFQLEPRFMDVIFDMSCLRITGKGMVLVFIEDKNDELMTMQ